MAFNEEDCKVAGGMGYFVLWAMQNYSNYLVRMVSNIGNVHGAVTGFLSGMPEVFTDDGDVPKDNTVGSMSILSTFLPAAAWAVPEAKFVGAGVSLLGGVFGALGTNPPQLLFDEFAQASDALSQSIISLQNAIYTIANDTLIAVPSNAPGYVYASDAQQLPQILMDGVFAADVTSAIGLNPPEMIAALSSVAISWLWNHKKVAVIKINAAQFGAEVCGATPLWGEYTRCDGDGNAYTLAQFDPYVKNGQKRSAEGEADGLKKRLQHAYHNIKDPADGVRGVRGVEKLSNCFLTLEQVVLSSEFTQSVTKAWRSELSGGDMVSRLEANGGSQGQAELSTAFNLPVCDLTHMIPINAAYLKRVGNDDGTCGGSTDCWKKTVMYLCGNAKDMPYHADGMSNPDDDECSGAIYSTLPDW
ncbi:uncharacterized protein BDZ99DRAFT_565664 [Mytilinidion resinicola]|uniref:Uncharacterized protein n=1 Tax=Mytilinidion resinicola TaxID=574789 RepID=A0A6A6Z641_9PEZI|nr:uncharacterized protein BDZ99DRAFT_565664 [Mytilinidion resinicola]KAF2815727.1 hypothetical protein BDZ99DRAFT_565664 [Mytilinidion resinicola]